MKRMTVADDVENSRERQQWWGPVGMTGRMMKTMMERFRVELIVKMVLIRERKMKTMVVRAIVWALSASSFNLNQPGASYEQRCNRIGS